ncbi:MAG: class E sortase [Actinomycetota bacterium]|nr:class E sortase [Actinomycetota bacterium]
MRGRKGVFIALSLSVIVVVALAVMAPILYSRFRSSSAEEDGDTPVADDLAPLTHDELLGAPLSFETPAYLYIPAVEVYEEVREGSDDEEELYATLELGPVHLTHTGYPGWPGNCVISGHRTTFTKPFNRLDEIIAGDIIYIENPRGQYEYRAYEFLYIDPMVNVTPITQDPILTLTTCAPEGSATLRLVVRASLENFTPVETMEEE